MQLQKGLTFVVVDWGYKQQALDTHNQCGINTINYNALFHLYYILHGIFHFWNILPLNFNNSIDTINYTPQFLTCATISIRQFSPYVTPLTLPTHTPTNCEIRCSGL